ncbi:MAG: hypothetical protein R3E08_04015 [Thiotrichaceae bacterium]
MIKVTFDFNVWEKVVCGEAGFEKIRELIYSRQIQGYICEIAISLHWHRAILSRKLLCNTPFNRLYYNNYK